MVRSCLAIVVFLAASLGAVATPHPPRKPLTRVDILYLLNNYVPSDAVTNLVTENGVDFDPDESYLKKVQAAGGKDDVLNALMEFLHFQYLPFKISALAPLGERVDRSPRFHQRGRDG